MKGILLSFFAACLLGVTQAKASSADTCMCYTSINVDSGHTSKKCNADSAAYGACECTPVSQACQYATTAASTSSCPSGYTELFQRTVTGRKCCTKACYRGAEETEQVRQESIQKSAEEDLAGVYDSSRSIVYFGVVDSVNRSPSGGRGNSVAAKLDACMNNVNVSSYSVGNQISWNSCRSDCDSAQNGYCNNSGTNNGNTETAAACKDRCDCYIGGYNGYSCEGL